MHIAVVGCSHGEIDKIYEVVQSIEVERRIKVKLVLCCGDFQSVRNMTDLRCMNCPIKYQAMHDFHRYYSGEKKAPIPTIFIGGNHEASNFLQELPFGGWVAPNIYFCGYSTVLKFGPLRIAGISGIFKGQDYLKGRYECPPYDQNSIRSTYHYRNLDIFRLKQIRSHVDIVLSHDWPRGIYNYGNVHELLRKKPFFRDEVSRNELGSRPLFEVLTHLEPSYWFSAHMHVQFNATIPWTSAAPENKITKFLALDKVLPRRHFLQVLEIPSNSSEEELKLSFDPEWLAILVSTDHLTSAKPKPCFMPGPGCSSRFDFTPGDEEIENATQKFGNKLEIPNNFTLTAPVYIHGEKPGTAFPVVNPQTTEFCDKLGVTDPLKLTCGNSASNQSSNSSFITSDYSGLSTTFQEYSSINISTSSSYNNSSFLQNSSANTTNPDEIQLDLDDDDEIESSQCSKPCDISLNSPVCSSSKRTMLLPPPKSTSTPNKGSSQGTGSPEENDNDDVSSNEKDVKLLESIFRANESVDETEKSRNEKLLFVIDRSGERNEPDLKRRRNEEFLKSLENEAEEG